ncbi:MAG: DUF4159 domain-containing protein [Gemmatimonadaceae bacterium]
MPIPRARCLVRLGAVLLTLALPLRGANAQRPGRGFGRYFGRREMPDTTAHNPPYDGRFTFARIAFTTNSPAGFYYMGLPAWAHGYPNSERNLMHIIRTVSLLDTHPNQTVVVRLGDPLLFKYPVSYMTEADFWGMTDAEAANLRAYLLKGGFVIFDDFRDDFRDNDQGWANFAMQMHRVLPQSQIVDLKPTDPIFHSFFDIDSFGIVPQYYDRGPPVFRGIYEDNDPAKRLMVMINFNTDVSNFWEFSAEGWYPVAESNEAYKLGVNYVIYALTH